MRKTIIAAEIALSLLTAATPALAASGSTIGYPTGTTTGGILTGGGHNPNCVVFYTADNDGIAYGVSKSDPSVLNINNAKLIGTSIFFSDATVTAPPSTITYNGSQITSPLVTWALDCPTGVHYVYGVEN